jgi:hypothetical protein
MAFLVVRLRPYLKEWNVIIQTSDISCFSIKNAVISKIAPIKFTNDNNTHSWDVSSPLTSAHLYIVIIMIPFTGYFVSLKSNRSGCVFFSTLNAVFLSEMMSVHRIRR